MTVIFQFPGQSSLYHGMIGKLSRLGSTSREIIHRASTILGRDLMVHERRHDAYASNRDIQVGVFLASHVFLKELSRRGVEGDFSAGLSLGEWNHLVHIGALDFDDALRAVQSRGEAYAEGPRGLMAAVFPMPLADLETVVSGQRGDDVLEIVNLNSPRQNVIAGREAAVTRARRVLESQHFVDVTVIERSVPMHSTLFEGVAARFRDVLETVRFVTPRRPYVPNRLAELIPDPTDEQFVELLSTHACKPVLWQRCLDALLDAHPDAMVVEVGPRRVLTNLLDRKWHPGIAKFHVDTGGDQGATRRQLDTVAETLLQARAGRESALT